MIRTGKAQFRIEKLTFSNLRFAADKQFYFLTSKVTLRCESSLWDEGSGTPVCRQQYAGTVVQSSELACFYVIPHISYVPMGRWIMMCSCHIYWKYNFISQFDLFRCKAPLILVSVLGRVCNKVHGFRAVTAVERGIAIRWRTLTGSARFPCNPIFYGVLAISSWPCLPP